LPCTFTQWSLRDKNGRTVAHQAAQYGHLPSDFSDWGWSDNEGKTVADFAKEQYAQWKIDSGFIDNAEADAVVNAML
jgi:hypothetical protein